MSFQILGTGSYCPALTVDNDRLAQMMDTSDEWIRTRTGIEQRRVCTDETIAQLAAQAALNALENAGVSPQELDLIVCGTLGGDYITPSLACQVQGLIGASCPAFDLNAACCGFLYSLDVADGYFARGRVRRVLVIGADQLSRFVDWQDRATCVLFGDGAGAAVLGEGEGLLAMKLSTHSNVDALKLSQRRGNSPFQHKQDIDFPYLSMNGQEVYKFAVQAMSGDIKEVMEMAGLSEEDIDFVLPHQANIRIIQAAQKHLAIDRDKVVVNIQKYGNTSAASIAIALDELNRSGRLQRGNHLIFSTFGAGLTTAACALRW